MNLAWGSHVWELWELGLGFGTRGFFRCEAEAWLCGCSGGFQPFGNTKNQHQMVLGGEKKKKIPFESLKIFYELI